jgi:hypothetical protein
MRAAILFLPSLTPPPPPALPCSACSAPVQVGSNADSETSIWELQDKRVVIFHLVKWHRIAAGNVRDSSRTWWRQCITSEEPFSHLDVPHGDYYTTKS